MTAPTPEALAEAITHALGLVDTLAGDWALIWFDATYPAGRNPDRPTRARPINQADPDHVKAERDDPGIGDYRARQACNQASRHIGTAHRLAGDAVAALTGVAGPKTYQAPPRSAVDVRTVLAATEGRLEWLQTRDVAHEAASVRQPAHAAASALIAAHAALRAVMVDYDHVGEPTADRRCWNCGRPVEGRRECEACRKYRARAEAAIRAGRTVTHRLRPVPRYDDAHRARQRRTERLKPGQLDIEGPLPAGNWVDGEWTPATPHPTDPRKQVS